jgi:hypothetical protein
MRTLRRFLALAALFFWQGGFTFYSSVVVPLGQRPEFLGPRHQGFLTREVTNYLNLAGLVALPLLAWELAAGRDPGRARKGIRWGLWAVLAATLAGLYLLHGWLDGMMDPGSLEVDSRSFRPLHRLYLWVSTVQWGAAVGYLVLSLGAWRAADVRAGPAGARCAGA